MHSQSAKDMHYQWEKTLEILQQLDASGEFIGILDDILCGKAYINLVCEGTIGEYNSVLMLLMDGAQLHLSKQSDCWIYIWILVNLAPNKHYKVWNILPGGVIPGLDPPQDVDLFLFPGLAHVSALQHDGFPVWDAYY